MFTRRSKVRRLGLALSDLAITALSFELAYILRQHFFKQLPLFYLDRSVFVGVLASVVAIWWLVGTGLGIYRRSDLFDAARIGRDAIQQALLSTAILMGWLYLLKLGNPIRGGPSEGPAGTFPVSRLFILLFTVVNTALLLIWRLWGPSLRRVITPDASRMRYYVVVGTGDNAAEVARLIESSEAQGNRVLAFVRERPAAVAAATGAADTAPPVTVIQEGLKRSYPVRELGELHAMLEQHVVDEIIFAVSKQDLEQMEEIFLSCEQEGVKVRVLVNFFPHVTSDISLEKLQNLPLLTFSTTPENEYLLFVKRVWDVVLASAALLVTGPFMLLTAAAIKLTSAGPVIYSQLRCGLSGRRFRLYKFRSMYKDADRRRAEVAYLNEMDGPVFKAAHDPRITPVGRFLRKFSLDEWPQLINILKGDMSFVGPRPPLPEEVARYERWQRRRLRMKPGITCLWALEGRNKLDFRSWMRLDLHYIDHWSLLLDLKILLRTIPHVLSGKGI
jgi:exopolysaccharide biosynthesis polyprenyl glycosylphosphotransferase